VTGSAQPRGKTRHAVSAAARPPITGRTQKPCSHPPNRLAGAYDHRPEPGPGRTPHRTRSHVPDRQHVRVILPDEPPRLTPAAARALLRILLRAHAQADDRQAQEGMPMADDRTGLPAAEEEVPR